MLNIKKLTIMNKTNLILIAFRALKNIAQVFGYEVVYRRLLQLEASYRLNDDSLSDDEWSLLSNYAILLINVYSNDLRDDYLAGHKERCYKHTNFAEFINEVKIVL